MIKGPTMDRSVNGDPRLGHVILTWKVILLKLLPYLWVKGRRDWQFTEERKVEYNSLKWDGEKTFLKTQNDKCLQIIFISFSPTRWSALKIVSLILSIGTKIDAQSMLVDRAVSGQLWQLVEKHPVAFIKSLNLCPSLMMNKTDPVFFPDSSILKEETVSSDLCVQKMNPKQMP